MNERDAKRARKRRKKRRKISGLKRRWVMNSLSVVIVALSIGVVVFALAMTNYYYENVSENISNRARQAARFINVYGYVNTSYESFFSYIDRATTEFSDKDKLELQFVNTYGRIIVSSSGLTAGSVPGTSDIEQALKANELTVFRGYDMLTAERVISVSVPLYYADSTRQLGVVRYVSSLKKVDDQLIRLSLLALGVAGLMFFLILVSNLYFIRTIINPILNINESTKEIAKGKFEKKLKRQFDDEIGELCDSINYMTDEIRKAEIVKNEFMSSLSHELRTPLTAIGGWSETLLMGEGLSRDDLNNGLEIISKESQRLSQMVEELLDYSRIESGRMVLNVELFDLRGELSDAVYIYNDMVEKEGIIIKYDEPESEVMVGGDKNRIKQVFLNLIDNAMKYGRDGKVIEFSIFTDKDYARVEVRDFGVGILPEELPFVKEKFYKGSSKMRGTGIGLAVCDEIVRLHSGRLEVYSEVNKGTRVVVSLPLYKEDDFISDDEMDEIRGMLE